jgi:threonine/homoserine efflux transporter RhtA
MLLVRPRTFSALHTRRRQTVGFGILNGTNMGKEFQMSIIILPLKIDFAI